MTSAQTDAKVSYQVPWWSTATELIWIRSDILNCYCSFFCWIRHDKLTILVLKRNIQAQLERYHGYWCPGSLHHQNVSNSDIDYADKCFLVYHTCLPQKISTTCAQCWEVIENVSIVQVSWNKFRKTWVINLTGFPFHNIQVDLIGWCCYLLQLWGSCVWCSQCVPDWACVLSLWASDEIKIAHVRLHWCMWRREIWYYKPGGTGMVSSWEQFNGCQFILDLGAVFSGLSGIMLSKVLANERRRYNCNVFSHWLRPS